MTARPAAVLFDCDGVIVDSEPIAFDLLADDLAAHGLRVSHADIHRLFMGGTIGGVAETARGLGAALPDDWTGRFYEKLYARLAEGTPLIAGIGAVLDALDTAGIPYAVGSNGTQRKMRITLGQHPEIHRRLAGRLFSGQELGCPKPDPGLYLHAAHALGQPPERCAVVEDSRTGARAAAQAGMACYGYAPLGGSELAAEGATVFRRMADLPGLLGL